MEPPQRDAIAPLYDPRYEHDACGVGFVADAGGRSAARVLPLALAGLAALAHRGAFGADGASSDGAGISMPLERSLLEHLTGDPALAAARPAVAMLFLPAAAAAQRRARALVRDTLAAAALDILAWRDVPTDPRALGAAAR
jgi:glutamate synthase domain-containing protein 1